jgi:hypothetical protein
MAGVRAPIRSRTAASGSRQRGVCHGSRSIRKGSPMADHKDVNSLLALLGAALAAAAVVATLLVIGEKMPADAAVGAALVAAILIAYFAADAAWSNGFGEFMRGFLIGINAGLNFIIAFWLLQHLLGAAAAPPPAHPAAGHPPAHPAAAASGHAQEIALGVAIALGALNLTMVFSALTQNVVYKILVGYVLNALLPMSWLVSALGLLFFILNLLGGLLIGLPGVDVFKLTGVGFNWGTGTFFTAGGVFSNANPGGDGGAYNMGYFAFVKKADGDPGSYLLGHESGHALNLAAFGSIFHLIGALEENLIPGNGPEAYSEKLAESNVDPGSADGGKPSLAMWGATQDAAS